MGGGRNHPEDPFRMSLVVTAFIYLTILWLLGTLLQCVFLRLIRVPITKVKLFHGNTPVGFKVGGCQVSLGWIPVGSSVAYDTVEFFRKPWPIRLAGHFSVTVIALIAAGISLGGSQGWYQFLTGFRQIALGTWAPIDRATEYLSHWHEIAVGSPVASFGILAAKMAAFSIFPIGGSAIIQILADAGTSTGRQEIEKLAAFNALVAIMMMALWGFAAIWLMVIR